MIPARELRFVLVVQEYEAALRLYRDVFGLEVLEEFDQGAGRGALLKAPPATLELVDPAHARMVDEIEAGRPLEYGVKVAVAVDDLAEASRAVTATGARAVADPVETPWGDHNQRFEARDGTQLTLFQPP